MKSIGDRIRERREQLKMSQEELARKIGYKSRSSINKIEMEHYDLPQSKIKAIADALETTPSYVMGWEELNQEADLQQLQKNVHTVKTVMELVKAQYGDLAWDALSLYIQLDPGDQGEIRGYMKRMLLDEKYPIQEGHKNA